VERAWLDENTKKGRATVTLDPYSPNAWVGKSIRAGFLANVSTGYYVKAMDNAKTRGKDENGREIRTATSWAPFEISIVTVPADNSVGIGYGRSAEANEMDQLISELLNDPADRASQLSSVTTTTSTDSNTTTYGDDGSVVSESTHECTSTTVSTYDPDPDGDDDGDEMDAAPDGQGSDDALNAKNVDTQLIINRNLAQQAEEITPAAGATEIRNMSDNSTPNKAGILKELAKFETFAKERGISVEKAREAFESGRSFGDWANEIYDTASDSQPKISKREMRELNDKDYNRALAEWAMGTEESSLILEMGRQAMTDRGLPYNRNSFYVPLNVNLFDVGKMRAAMLQDQANVRVMAAQGGNQAGVAVPTLYGPFIDVLREATIAGSLGVQFKTGLQGSYTLLGETTASVFTPANNETGSVSANDLSLRNPFTLTPHMFQAKIPVTKVLQYQNAAWDIATIANNDLVLNAARIIDKEIFVGSGTGGHLTGLVFNNNVPINAGYSGSALASGMAAKRVQNMWVTARSFNGSGKGDLVVAAASYINGLNTGSVSGFTAGPTLFQVNPAAPYSAYCYGIGAPVTQTQWLTNITVVGNVRSPMLYGDFSKVYAGQWGPSLEIQLDPFTNADNSYVNYRAFLVIDTGVALPEALVRDPDFLG
jgi:HK97 family phage major capsid protein